MPNTTGGKNYKKSKHGGSSMKPAFIEKAADQMYGRLLRNLGNRNMLVYCNDGKIRLCHIRGSMRKRVWLNVGDIVLISLRDFEKTTDDDHTKSYDRGDIVAKYDEEHMSRLKKEPDINKRLFQQLETMDGTVLAEIGKKEKELEDMGIATGEDGFEFDDGKGAVKEESEDSDVDVDDI